MLPETSTQNWMFVSTRLLRGAPHVWGPARIMTTTARITAGMDSASWMKKRSHAPLCAPLRAPSRGPA